MTAPRRIVAGDTYLITRRCTRREYLLRPDEVTNEVFAYCLAEAAKRFGIGLIAWDVMSNHYHAVVHDPKGLLPAFLEHLHKMIAKTMNARWNRWENFWSTEETCVTRLVTDNDIFEKVLYVLCNPIAADLVDRLNDWPGVSSLTYLGTKTTTHKRPKFFFRDDGTMPETVKLTSMVPPSILEHETAAAWRARIRKALAERERTIREGRVTGKRRVVGRKAILRMPHTEKPTTASSPRKLRPAIACKDPERRELELVALKEFRARYADARKRWSSGARRTACPERRNRAP